MLTRTVQAAALQALKKLAGHRPITLPILHGSLRGYKWQFDASTNNEIILGMWEHNMQLIYRDFLRDGAVVFDLGAHQGFLALLASKLVGHRGTVHAFEASPINFKKLERNIQLNRIHNCRLVHAAVSDRDGCRAFSASIHDMGNTYLPSSPYFVNQPTVIVPTVSLDEYVSRESVDLPDFLKVDVEGAESDALIGAKALLASKRPIVYLETHNIHHRGVDGLCLRYLGELGYKIIRVVDQTPDNSMASYLLST
jgi:FkbM family methyltransferase